MILKDGTIRNLSVDPAHAGPHQRTLSLFLEMAFAGNAEHTELAKKRVPRLEKELGQEFIYQDPETGKVSRVRELLLSEKVESTTLVQTELAATVIEGASLAKCMREIVPSFDMRGPTDRVPLGGSKGYAAKVAPGAEPNFSREDYGYRDFVSFEVVERPSITEQLIADSRYPIIARQIAYSGEKIENKFNYEMLGVLLQNAGNEHDCTGSNTGRKAINGARKLIKADGYKPDVFVMCNDAEAVLLDEVTLTSYYGAEVIANGNLPNLFGMRPAICDTTTSSSSYTWDYDSDGDIGMLLIQSGVGGLWGRKKPLTVKTGEDIVRRIREIVISEEYAVNYGQADALCRVEY